MFQTLTTVLTTLVGAPLAAGAESRARAAVESAAEARELATPNDLAALGVHLAHARAALDELATELTEAKAAFARLQTRAAEAPDPEPTPADEAALIYAGIVATDEAHTANLDALFRGITTLSDRFLRARDATDAAGGRVERSEADVQAAVTLAAATTARLAALHDPTAPTRPAEPPAEPPVAPPVEPPAQASAASERKFCHVDGCEAPHRARGMCGKHYQLYKRGHLPGVVLEDGVIFFEDGPRVQLDKALAGTFATRTEDGVFVAGQRVG